MARILTGIQSTGRPHLGNILGAIVPAIKMSQEKRNESLFFIADLHSLTRTKHAEKLRHDTLATAATWLAFGFDTDNNIFYRQSDVTEVCELTWYLSCLTPFPMLANAHSFKDKSSKLSDVNSGLFTYPVLMAADILLYDADKVPVGKDQQQHLEMARDIGGSFNSTYGETFVLPEALYDENVQTVPGTDGQKMSKSYGNIIDIFLPEKELKRQVMAIVTDSRPLEEPKNPETCNVFSIFRLLADDDAVAKMRRNYLAGGYGYGHAKKELLAVLLDKFAEQRSEFDRLMDNPELVEEKLKSGAEKAKKIALKKLVEVREKIGYA